MNSTSFLNVHIFMGLYIPLFIIKYLPFFRKRFQISISTSPYFLEKTNFQKRQIVLAVYNHRQTNSTTNCYLYTEKKHRLHCSLNIMLQGHISGQKETLLSFSVCQVINVFFLTRKTVVESLPVILFAENLSKI